MSNEIFTPGFVVDWTSYKADLVSGFFYNFDSKSCICTVLYIRNFRLTPHICRQEGS
jgi:hypothetical protein